MYFVGYKPSSYKVAKVMERIIKENNKGGMVANAFLKYAFCYDNLLIAGNNHRLVCIKTTFLTGIDDAELKQGGVYTFKTSSWSKSQYCIELNEVKGVYVPNSVAGILQFGSTPDMNLSFGDIDSWFAFNYRLANFNYEYLKDAYAVVGKYVVNNIFFNPNSRGGVSCVKVENDRTMIVYGAKSPNSNDVVKPCTIHEVFYGERTELVSE